MLCQMAALLDQIEYQGNKLVVSIGNSANITHLGKALIPALPMRLKLKNVLVILIVDS